MFTLLISYTDHLSLIFFFFFFNDTATTEIYTLSLHDALPIVDGRGTPELRGPVHGAGDRGSQIRLPVSQRPHASSPPAAARAAPGGVRPAAHCALRGIRPSAGFQQRGPVPALPGARPVSYRDPSGELRQPELIERATELRRIAIDAKGSGAQQLTLAVAAAQQPNAENARTPRREVIPDRIPDHVALARRNPEALQAGEEEVRLGLGARDIAPIDHHDIGPDTEHLERAIDFRASP